MVRCPRILPAVTTVETSGGAASVSLSVYWVGLVLYHGRVDLTWVHIHPADVIEGVDVSFLKGGGKKEGQRINGKGLRNVAPWPATLKALGSIPSTNQTGSMVPTLLGWPVPTAGLQTFSEYLVLWKEELEPHGILLWLRGADSKKIQKAPLPAPPPNLTATWKS